MNTDNVDQIPAQLSEYVNALFLTLAIGLIIIFSRYLIIEIHQHGFDRYRLRAAVSIYVFMVGEAMTRGWVWLARFTSNNGLDWPWVSEQPAIYIYIVGPVVGAAGILCMIRVFSPDAWGHYGWVVCLILALMTVGFSMLF